MENDFFLSSCIQPHSQFELSSDCYFNPNIENSMEHFSQFESALSSMVSSPVSASNSVVSNESNQIRELIGKLGTVCHSSEIPVNYPGSTSTSCFTTPMDSPRKLNYPVINQFMKEKLPIMGNSIVNYPPVSGDPGFAERAAKFSCFGSRSFNGRQTNGSEMGGYKSSPLMGNNVNLTTVLSSPSLNVDGSQIAVQEKKNLGQKQVDIRLNQRSPISTEIPGFNSKKRKAVSRGKSKERKVAVESEILESKRLKDNEGNGSESGSGRTELGKHGKGNRIGAKNEEAKAKDKQLEPPKDYIHVRARRGQATDSHSLAERVRREKISERMKLLQDLVPGCNKVTGKALMLDEIINYVQTLQSQVEFLSMKLATVNTRLDFDMDSLLPKNVVQANGSMGNETDTSASSLFGHHNQKLTQVHNNNFTCNGATIVDPLHTIFRNTIGSHSSQLHDFSNNLTQFQTLCEDDLQSIARMRFGRDTNLDSRDFRGTNEACHMKVEL